MGLDMYLEKRIYVGAYHDHRKVEGNISLTCNGKPIVINLKNVADISERVAYWRKATQIHNWFVHNVQNGEDNCDEYGVTYKDLMKLKDLCEEVIRTKDASLLPPAEGFFFGSTEIDDAYFTDLQYTVDVLKSLDPNGDYSYWSS